MRTPLLPLVIPMFATLIVGCGDGDDGRQGGSTACDATTTTDGKLHPEPDGTHVSEGDACAQLHAAFDARSDALHCVGTTALCPAFLRTQWNTADLEYDQGTVAECAAWFGAQTGCEALLGGMDYCIVTPYPTPEREGGCP